MLLEVFGSEAALDQVGSIHPTGRNVREEEILMQAEFAKTRQLTNA
jgi:hypothetical protein